MSDNVSHETLTRRLNRYLRAVSDRDSLVKDMFAAGYSKRKIALKTGLGRTTVYRILGAAYPYDHGAARFTEPKERTS